MHCLNNLLRTSVYSRTVKCLNGSKALASSPFTGIFCWAANLGWKGRFGRLFPFAPLKENYDVTTMILAQAANGACFGRNQRICRYLEWKKLAFLKGIGTQILEILRLNQNGKPIQRNSA